MLAGTVVTVTAERGQHIAQGDPLVSIEAMKMETMLCAERNAVVHAVFVKPSSNVMAKNLLVELE